MTYYTSDIITPEAVADDFRNASDSTPAEATYNRLYTQLAGYAREASELLARWTNRAFVPYYATETTPYRFGAILKGRMLRWQLGALVLMLHADALQVDTVIWDNTTLTSSQYTLLASDDTSAGDQLHIDPDVAISLSSDFGAGVSIAGWWGYHTDYANAYRDVETVTVTDSATSLSVTDASAYETRQYLKIEDELLQITARDEGADTLTVTRGVNGTTAAAHTSQTVAIYVPPPDVTLLARRLAKWLFETRSGVGTTVMMQGGAVAIDALPESLKAGIQMHRRYHIGGVA